MIETKHKILDTAERLIAEQGYAATSLRHIIAEAGVNLAAIHYHFGSKEELLDEVILRKAEPMNQERLARLDQAEMEAAPKPPAVKAILAAFLRPMAEMADRDPSFVAVMGRIIAEGLLPAVVQRHFQHVSARILGALRRAVPRLSEEEFAWRTHFMFGAMAFTMCAAGNFPHPAAQGDFRERIERLITFVAAGMEAPETEIAKSAEMSNREVK